MLKMTSAACAISSQLGMIAAVVTVVMSRFRDHSNDTVPMFTVGISVFFAVVCIALCICAGAGVIGFIYSEKSNTKRLLLGIAMFMNLIFAGVCMLLFSEQWMIVVVYAAATTMLHMMALVMATIGGDDEGKE